MGARYIVAFVGVGEATLALYSQIDVFALSDGKSVVFAGKCLEIGSTCLYIILASCQRRIYDGNVSAFYIARHEALQSQFK